MARRVTKNNWGKYYENEIINVNYFRIFELLLFFYYPTNLICVPDQCANVPLIPVGCWFDVSQPVGLLWVHGAEIKPSLILGINLTS